MPSQSVRRGALLLNSSLNSDSLQDCTNKNDRHRDTEYVSIPIDHLPPREEQIADHAAAHCSNEKKHSLRYPELLRNES
jgi:hypothetical protein